VCYLAAHSLSRCPSPPQFFDDNLDGLVSIDELTAAWRRAANESGGSVTLPSELELRKVLVEGDTDGDGFLSEEDFYAILDLIG
jgi:Ca2+-binding EF-hand superfamily protein